MHSVEQFINIIDLLLTKELLFDHTLDCLEVRKAFVYVLSGRMLVLLYRDPVGFCLARIKGRQFLISQEVIISSLNCSGFLGLDFSQRIGFDLTNIGELCQASLNIRVFTLFCLTGKFVFRFFFFQDDIFVCY